jgi:ELWxxDGT repeat protein
MKSLILLFSCFTIAFSVSAQYSAEMVGDFSPGLENTVESKMTSIGGKLYFSKRHNDHQDPYVYNGTGITQLLELGDVAQVEGFAGYNGKAYFLVVGNALSGLWESDGTIAGTKNIVNIRMDDDQSFDTYSIVVYNNKLYFPQYIQQQLSSSAIWQSDGTTARTTKLKDIVGNTYNSFEAYFFEFGITGGKMRFRTMGNYPEDYTWVSNGTTTGTYKVTDDWQDAHFQYNGKGYFCPTPASATALWATDGTSGGTYKVKDLYAVNVVRGCVGNFHILKGKLFFTVKDTNSRLQLWITDGSEAGTNLITLTSGKYQITGLLFQQIGDTLLFAFLDGVISPPTYYLCATDGTQAGTYIVSKDFPLGSEYYKWNLYPSYIYEGKLFFPYIKSNVANPTKLKGLFYSDGTEAGTGKVELADNAMEVVGNFDTLNGELYFVGSYPRFGSELWKVNNHPLSVQTTVATGTEPFIYPNPANNTFSIQTDNTNNTTVKVFSLTGQLLLQTRQTQNISIAQLPAGIYMVQVIADGKVHTEKLVKE